MYILLGTERLCVCVCIVTRTLMVSKMRKTLPCKYAMHDYFWHAKTWQATEKTMTGGEITIQQTTSIFVVFFGAGKMFEVHKQFTVTFSEIIVWPSIVNPCRISCASQHRFLPLANMILAYRRHKNKLVILPTPYRQWFIPFYVEIFRNENLCVNLYVVIL